MNSLISIVIPAYNVENYLDKCLESVVKQTYLNIEIIIVNDGSTDNTLNKCIKWSEIDKRIKYITQKNAGLSAARNTGIRHANGEYIMFIDSDDFVKNNMVEVLYKNLVNTKSDISICNRYYYYESNGNIKLRYPDKNTIKVMDKLTALEQLINMTNFDMSAWCKLYRKNFFDKIEFPVGKLCEDYYIMYQLFDLSDRVVYDSKPLLYYVQRDGSISKKKSKLMDYIYAATAQKDFIVNKYPELAIYANSAYVLSHLTVYNKQLINSNDNDIEFRKEILIVLKKYKKYVFENKNISIKRKLEVILFIYFPHLYNITLKFYKRSGE